VWGTWRLHDDQRMVGAFGTVKWRAVSQLSAYWHYKWGLGGPDTWIWVGVPDHTRLTGAGSLGDYIAAALATYPLSDRVGAYALVSYMHQSAAPGIIGAAEDAWNFSIGLTFYPARNARTNTVAGQCWTPQLPVANNGYFLVDTNKWY
jgi:hypothetical protein